MNIVVLVKQVPDTWAERKLKDADGTLDRASVDGLINELDEYAIEEGLQIAEAQREAGADAEVTILTMGPEKAAESIRKALSMGADKAVHLLDDGWPAPTPCRPPTRSPRSSPETGFDLVICGSESTDARMGVMAAMLAERLGVPQVSLASKVEIDGSAIRIRRVSEDGYFEVESTLPAVISVVEKINEPATRRSRASWPRRRSRCRRCRWPTRASTRPWSGWAARPPRWSITPSARRARPERSSRTKETAASRSPSSSPRRSSSEGPGKETQGHG
jgi:Electron transfer flavoprotein, beta subunit